MRTTRPAHSLCSVFLRARVAQVLYQAGARMGPGCKIRAGCSERVVMSAQARTHARTHDDTNKPAAILRRVAVFTIFRWRSSARRPRPRPTACRTSTAASSTSTCARRTSRPRSTKCWQDKRPRRAAGRTHNDGSALPSCLEVLQGVVKTGKKNFPVLTPRRSTV